MKVLMAVDSRENASVLINYISKHKFANLSEIRVIHVIEPVLVGSYMSVFPAPVLNEIQEHVSKISTTLVGEVSADVKSKFPGASITEEIIEGYPKQEINNAAKTWGAELIIVGSHSKQAVQKLFIGSVSQAVASTAPCPVLIVPTSQHR